GEEQGAARCHQMVRLVGGAKSPVPAEEGLRGDESVNFDPEVKGPVLAADWQKVRRRLEVAVYAVEAEGVADHAWGVASATVEDTIIDSSDIGGGAVGSPRADKSTQDARSGGNRSLL